LHQRSRRRMIIMMNMSHFGKENMGLMSNEIGWEEEEEKEAFV
jgi:hypothetical protein